MVLGQWFPSLHRNSPFELLPFINIQFSCGTGHPNHVVALLSPSWMLSNPTESFLGAPLCLVMTVRWLLAAVLMQMHIWVCSHDIFPILWSKTCLWTFSREKTLTWDTVKSAFAFTYSRKFSEFGFVFSHWICFSASDHQGKNNHTGNPGKSSLKWEWPPDTRAWHTRGMAWWYFGTGVAAYSSLVHLRK